MFSEKKLTVGRYTLGLLITTGLGLAVAISDGILAGLSEKNFNAANEVFTPEETRWIVSFISLEVSCTKLCFFLSHNIALLSGLQLQ